MVFEELITLFAKLILLWIAAVLFGNLIKMAFDFMTFDMEVTTCFCIDLVLRRSCRDIHQDIENGLPSSPVVHHAMQRQPSQTQLYKTLRPIMVGTIVRYEEEEKIESHCSECVICLEEFRGGDCCRVLPNCKHQYHQHCIDEWLVKDRHCPLCRGSVHGLEPTPITVSH
ncbi:hypothetical protein E1A91_A10G226000v1 [Gossypium mustelinum]|uniref:RING-type E3 ubiquitin transferase n=1 Tax=Gossypium mustelinum TaxID=34275 RepID=A0A5D2XPV9_GOSMU|nr:hypothetical protein E1A91_A10G226000v1 [Gossypium mustelinum]